jgi:hypothetical protein
VIIGFGELIPIDGNSLWLVFQEEPRSEKMIPGFITGVNKTAPLRGYYETVVGLGRLAEDAEYALQESSSERQTITITRFDEMDLLWEKHLEENDEVQWNLLGKLRYRALKDGKIVPIRGVTISGVPKKVIENLVTPDYVPIPSDFRERVDE